LTILPCELVPDNGIVVRDLVLKQASLWNLDRDFLVWLRNSCRWVSTLVDRIVPGVPENHPLLFSDPLLLSAEPYALWALQGRRDELPLTDHPAVVAADDITPYALRKVRILNGAHTALVAKAMPMGIGTVREAVEHPEIGPWLKRLLFEEIVPTLQGRVVDPEGFAQATLDRFANPFLNHNLADIAKGHEGKVALRLEPTLSEFRECFGKEPPILAELLQNSAR
jgi:tagaturonate reductase